MKGNKSLFRNRNQKPEISPPSGLVLQELLSLQLLLSALQLLRLGVQLSLTTPQFFRRSAASAADAAADAIEASAEILGAG